MVETGTITTGKTCTSSGFKRMSLVQAIAAFLVQNGVRYAFGIGGHGNTPFLEALLPYDRQGSLKVVDVQHEAIAAHAATALKWVYGIESIVFTSIGPGWFNTLLAQNTAMSNGRGFLVFAGDKTTAYEGPNMQQIMRDGQFGYQRAADSIAKKAYTLVDPRNVYTILKEALAKTREPSCAGPVNIFLPLNLQAAEHEYNLDLLFRPVPAPDCKIRPDIRQLERAGEEIRKHARIAIRVGGGAGGAGKRIKALAERTGAAVIMSPVIMDEIESDFPLNVGPAGSKGSISGNFAAENATLIINAGTRGVCQSDCSGTLYTKAKQFVNINLNPIEALRYDGIPLVGDVSAVLEDLLSDLATHQGPKPDQQWLSCLASVKRDWESYLQEHFDHPILEGRLTQPAAIKIVDDHVNSHGGIKIFDAGDVQAHGFQIARHLEPNTFLNDAGNSCMGFGVSAGFALGLVRGGRRPTVFTGDGSLLIQAQAIRDMVKHGSKCTVVVFDNQGMEAITALQRAQGYADFATQDAAGIPAIDFVGMARSMGCPGFTSDASPESLRTCLELAHCENGPALVDVKVYAGAEKYGALGAFGRWNVGPWSPEVEALWEGKA